MNIHVKKSATGPHAMLKRQTRLKRRLRQMTWRARQSKAILLFAIILALAVAALYRQGPVPSTAPPVATDRMCQIIWESVGFFERVGIQAMRESQFQHYSRACR